MRADGASVRLLGINRLPGAAEDCGVAGFTATGEPRQNSVCTGPNDIVVFTPQFGAPLPAAPNSGPALQTVVDPQGQVVSVGTPGGTLPAGDWAVQAIGPAMTVTSAGPILLQNGRPAIDAAAEDGPPGPEQRISREEFRAQLGV